MNCRITVATNAIGVWKSWLAYLNYWDNLKGGLAKGGGGVVSVTHELNSRCHACRGRCNLMRMLRAIDGIDAIDTIDGIDGIDVVGAETPEQRL